MVTLLTCDILLCHFRKMSFMVGIRGFILLFTGVSAQGGVGQAPPNFEVRGCSPPKFAFLNLHTVHIHDSIHAGIAEGRKKWRAHYLFTTYTIRNRRGYKEELILIAFEKLHQ